MDAIVAPPRGGLVNCVAAVGQSNCVLQELLKQAEDIGCLRLEGNLTRVFIGLVRHITEPVFPPKPCNDNLQKALATSSCVFQFPRT